MEKAKVVPRDMEELYDLPLLFKELTLAGYDVDRERYTGKLPNPAKPRWWSGESRWIGLSYIDTGISALWHLRVGNPYQEDLGSGPPYMFYSWMHFSRKDFHDALDLFRDFLDGRYDYDNRPER